MGGDVARNDVWEPNAGRSDISHPRRTVQLWEEVTAIRIARGEQGHVGI